MTLLDDFGFEQVEVSKGGVFYKCLCGCKVSGGHNYVDLLTHVYECDRAQAALRHAEFTTDDLVAALVDEADRVQNT